MANNSASATYAGVNFGKKKAVSILCKVLIYIFLIIWALTTIFPFLWVTMNSFKLKTEVLTHSFALPIETFTLDNYATAFERTSIGTAYINSVIISGSVTVLVLFFGSMTAFAMVRYRFAGKSFINALFGGSLMIPAFATIIPVFIMISKLKLVNNPIGVILPQIAGNLSFAIIVMMGFMVSLPMELEEAAFLEGCNPFQIYYKIIVPLSRPVLASVAIFVFLWSYNDLFLQLIILRRKEAYPICTLLNEISTRYGTDYGLMCSAVTLVVVPVLIVYLFLQKNIIKGLTAGAVKG